MTGPRPSTTT